MTIGDANSEIDPTTKTGKDRTDRGIIREKDIEKIGEEQKETIGHNHHTNMNHIVTNVETDMERILNAKHQKRRERNIKKEDIKDEFTQYNQINTKTKKRHLNRKAQYQIHQPKMDRPNTKWQQSKHHQTNHTSYHHTNQQ